MAVRVGVAMAGLLQNNHALQAGRTDYRDRGRISARSYRCGYDDWHRSQRASSGCALVQSPSAHRYNGQTMAAGVRQADGGARTVARGGLLSKQSASSREVSWFGGKAQAG